MEPVNSTKGERRILVADVDPDTRVLIASVVAILGYTPIVVQSGAEAVASSETTPLDLAILDFSMPDIDGLRVCQAIKDGHAGDFIPVLMLTARDTIRDKVRAFSEGVDEYLTKPINYEELQARINALLRIRDLHNQLVKTNQELQRVQEKLIAQERQLAVGQLAGAAAHQLGQPLSSILLNCFLIEQLPKSDAKFVGAVNAIKSDAKRMAEMIDKLRSVDAAEREAYFGATEILKLDKKL
jgi:DNA-binding response OmpR family regulator